MYEQYGSKLYSYAIRTWSISEDDAWEMVYKTLYKVLENFAKYNFDSEQKFASFIFVSFRNQVFDYFRSEKRISERLKLLNYNEMLFDDASENPGLSTEREVKRKLYADAIQNYWENPEVPSPLMEYLREALEKLEDWERVLLLQRSCDVSYKEIAKFIDKPEGQLKVYYQRLKKKIEEAINIKIDQNSIVTKKEKQDPSRILSGEQSIENE